MGGCRMHLAESRDIYEHGDIYDSLGACDDLSVQLSRLKRRRIISEEEWAAISQGIDEIRALLQGHLPAPTPLFKVEGEA